MKKSLIFLSFFFIVSIATANINLSIQSDNDLTASIRSVSDFSNVGNVNQSESIDLPYQSYEITITSDTTNVSYSSFWGFLGGVTGKGTFLILIVFLLFLVYGFMRGLR